MSKVEINPDIFPKLLNVLNLIVHYEKNKSKRKHAVKKDIFQTTFKNTPRQTSKSIGRECVYLLAKSIASHRYKEAVKLLWMLCQDKSIFVPFLFKSMMVVLINLDFDGKPESLWKFICSVQTFRSINKREVQLEYLMHRFKNERQDIHRVVEEFAALKSNLKKHNAIDPILEAYIALLDYIEWSQTSYDDMLLSQSQASREKATLALEKFIQNPGDWDIFILKLIKMMQSCDKQEDIELVLLKYLESNPDNINAYIYLCAYLYRFSPESENLLKYLEIIAEKCPSDLRILWLLNIWDKQEIEFSKRVRCIFMFLDYPSNGNNVSAWEKLSQYLSEAAEEENKKKIKAINSLWKSRYGSWNWMYFNLNHISKLCEDDILLISRRIAVLSFFDAESKYIKKVMKLFPVIRNQIHSSKYRSYNIQTY